MSVVTLYSLVESPTHPDFGALYRSLGITEIKLSTGRKAMSQLKKKAPDFLVAEFFYGYGNNYAGVNMSNLDVMLYSMQKYAPRTKLIVLVAADERKYVDKLAEIFPLHAVLKYPVAAAEMEALLR